MIVSKLEPWQRFVIERGAGCRASHLAAITGKTVAEIVAMRPYSRGSGRHIATYAERFEQYHGRPPKDSEWPVPARTATSRAYEWLGPEDALLAMSVGRMSMSDIAAVLTRRLQALTGDPSAIRTPCAVQVRISHIGMTNTDLVGHITVAQAAMQVGARSVIDHAIQDRKLSSIKVGRLRAIPHQEWKTWLASRRTPGPDMVRLASLRSALGFSGDKLAEYAKAGYVPTAELIATHGAAAPSTKLGSWYIKREIAEQLLADRKAGRPMPWFGKPSASNLRATWKRLVARRHPAECPACKAIWGPAGAPMTYDDYYRRYPPLAFGAKRHLTMPWSPGITIAQVARQARRTPDQVRTAIDNGVLKAARYEAGEFVTRSDATRWIARHCPSGEGESSWIGKEAACHAYWFTPPEIDALIAAGTLKARTMTSGPRRGSIYVLKQQCAEHRNSTGIPAAEAARRIGISESELPGLMQDLDWRGSNSIPLAVVQAAIRRREAVHGFTIDEAADHLKVAPQWIHDRVADGTVRLTVRKWAPDRPTLSVLMMPRLIKALEAGVEGPPEVAGTWIRLSAAAHIAGVSPSTVILWASQGDVKRDRRASGWHYQVDSLKARAKRYWQHQRYKRAKPPTWLNAQAA